MRPLTVLCDLDGMVVDLLAKWLENYNAEYGDKLTKDDIKSWDMHKNVKTECGFKIYNFIDIDECYTDLPPLPGALAGIEEIKRMGHEVVIVSASSKNPLSAARKISWCRRHLEMKRNDIIIATKKYLVSGDVLLEDSPINIAEYRTRWPRAAIAGIAYPYNQGASAVLFPDHNDTIAAWNGIVQYVKDLGEMRDHADTMRAIAERGG